MQITVTSSGLIYGEKMDDCKATVSPRNKRHPNISQALAPAFARPRVLPRARPWARLGFAVALSVHPSPKCIFGASP